MAYKAAPSTAIKRKTSLINVRIPVLLIMTAYAYLSRSLYLKNGDSHTEK